MPKKQNHTPKSQVNTIDFREYIDRLEQDRRDMEKRLTEEAKEREQRTIAMEQRLMDDAREREQRSREERKELENKIDTFVAETKTANRWFIGFNIAALIGVAGIIITLINILINGNGI
ncbi:MAG: hypothetical protein FWG63_01870 [Defluviitaleaceae bacterium]|nr:hypothetical protein [Defluviitaleaceae bacterium]